MIFRVHGYRYLPQEMKINYNTEQKAFGGSLQPELIRRHSPSVRYRLQDSPTYREDAQPRHDLPGGVIYQVQQVPDLAATNRLMERVRAYRSDRDG